MKKTALALVLLAGAVLGVTRLRDDAPTPTKDHLVTNRIWIDHIPRHDREMFHLFAMLTRQPIGIFDVRSSWAGTFEAFRYELHGNEVRAVFPQTGARETFSVVAKECNEGRMDFCLEISGASRGAKRYYSREGWEIPPNATAEQISATAETLLADPTSARK